MFLRNILLHRTNQLKKCMYLDLNIARNTVHYRSYCGMSPNSFTSFSITKTERDRRHQCCNLHRLKWDRRLYSGGILDGDITQLLDTNKEIELKKISTLFPQPRVTLNELASRTPDKIFDVIYKQASIAPKGARKKSLQGDWTCVYSFVWPEKVKFESTAISKRQAAEKAAIQALHYLHANKRIDSSGHPIYAKEVLNEIQSTLNEPIRVSISDDSVKRLSRLWQDYENGIKQIYERTNEEAKHKVYYGPSSVIKDSRLDERESILEDEIDEISAAEELSAPEAISVHPVFGRKMRKPTAVALKKRNDVLKRTLEIYDEEISPLPIDGYSNQIATSLNEHRVLILSGAAGCGKSTRAPIAVLKDKGAYCNVIVSEPRRVAAIGLAGRVAGELNEEVGATVGYQIRLDSAPPRGPGGAILYCTAGVLLRRLRYDPGLSGCTHVFIDEAHERDVTTDVTLLLLRKALDINPDLKAVIMSATLDTEVFSRYFPQSQVLEIPGRNFPVELSYLEDIQKKYNLKLPRTIENFAKEGKPVVYCDEIAEVLKALDKSEPEGAILVFLPGWSEIKQVRTLLEEYYGTANNTHLILPVHSRLSTSDQAKMFSHPPPGVRKIVLSTTIAETSVTVPDAVCVLDTGTHRVTALRERTGTTSLETAWISLASARQRAGRAGRVKPGHCFKLYSKEKENEFAPHSTPEILRVPLIQTVLDCKTYAPEEEVEEFLSQLPEPPSPKAIRFAVEELIDLGALAPSGGLTRLGSILPRLPLPPTAAVLIIRAASTGAVPAVADMLAHLDVELFDSASDRGAAIRETKRQFSDSSDFSALHWIQREYEQRLATDRQSVGTWLEGLGLRRDRLRHAKALSSFYIEQLLKCGVVEPTVEVEDLSRFSDIEELTTALLLSSFNILLRTRKRVKSKGKLRTVVELVSSTGERAHLSSSSIAHGTNSPNKLLTTPMARHCATRRALLAYSAGHLAPQAVILFGRGALRQDVKEKETVLSLPKLRFDVSVPNSQAEIFVRTKDMLWSSFDYYINRDLKTIDYEVNESVSRFRTSLIKTICRILVEANGYRGNLKSDIADDEIR